MSVFYFKSRVNESFGVKELQIFFQKKTQVVFSEAMLIPVFENEVKPYSEAVLLLKNAIYNETRKRSLWTN